MLFGAGEVVPEIRDASGFIGEGCGAKAWDA
jgi:hypothetical protein